MTFVEHFVGLFIESAPFLLLGMFIAGVIHQLVPRSWVEKTLGQNSSVVTAAVIGAPLPLCSCSVIPVAMGIRRSGASKASTASFLVATPETGVDSVGITYALMGPVMAVARPVAAISSAIISGMAIRIFGHEQAPTVSEPEVKSCCSANKQPTQAQESFSVKIRQAFRYGYGKLLEDFMLWLLIGITFAALIQTFVPQDLLTQYGSGVLAMSLVVLISIPMYICATASTPIAVGLMMSGISPGAALVFMLTGPATNIATLMVVKNELGKKELAIYLTSVIGSAITAGLTLDYVIATTGWQLNLVHGAHDDMVNTLYQVSAVILAGLILYRMSRKFMPRVLTMVGKAH